MGSTVKKIGNAFGDVVKTGVRTGLAAVSGGASEALFKKKKAGKVSGTAEEMLLADQEANSRRRQRLYATSGAAKGEEVAAIGLAGDVRGSIFGNK